MTRQEYNIKIHTHLKERRFFESLCDESFAKFINEVLDKCIMIYPDQRFGQIFTNYVYPNYRNRDNIVLNSVMDMLFYGVKMDPFYEESSETSSRLIPINDDEYNSEDYDKVHELWNEERANRGY